MKERYIDYQEPALKAAMVRYQNGCMIKGDIDLMTQAFRKGNATRNVPARNIVSNAVEAVLDYFFD